MAIENNMRNEWKEWMEWDQRIWGGAGLTRLDSAVLPIIFTASYEVVAAMGTTVSAGGPTAEAQLAAMVGFAAIVSSCIVKETMRRILQAKPQRILVVVKAQREQVRSIAMIGALAAMGSVLVGGIAVEKVTAFAAFSIGVVRYFAP